MISTILFILCLILLIIIIMVNIDMIFSVILNRGIKTHKNILLKLCTIVLILISMGIVIEMIKIVYK